VLWGLKVLGDLQVLKEFKELLVLVLLENHISLQVFKVVNHY
jgi:hypothetical protein